MKLPIQVNSLQGIALPSVREEGSQGLGGREPPGAGECMGKLALVITRSTPSEAGRGGEGWLGRASQQGPVGEAAK